MSEASLWADVRESLSPFGRLVRVENLVDPGTPDVAYTLTVYNTRSGWLELKHMDAWPKNADTPVCIRTLRREQVLWMERWALEGGEVFTLLRVGDRNGHHVLMDSLMTRAIFDRTLTRDDVFRRTDRTTEGFVPGRLLRWLTDG